jgi:hypothetical protein
VQAIKTVLISLKYILRSISLINTEDPTTQSVKTVSCLVNSQISHRLLIRHAPSTFLSQVHLITWQSSFMLSLDFPPTVNFAWWAAIPTVFEESILTSIYSTVWFHLTYCKLTLLCNKRWERRRDASTHVMGDFSQPVTYGPKGHGFESYCARELLQWFMLWYQVNKK